MTEDGGEQLGNLLRSMGVADEYVDMTLSVVGEDSQNVIIDMGDGDDLPYVDCSAPVGYGNEA